MYYASRYQYMPDQKETAESDLRNVCMTTLKNDGKPNSSEWLERKISSVKLADSL